MRTFQQQVPCEGDDWITVAAHLPDAEDLPADPVVLFAWPGGGYSREYFDLRLPHLGQYSQAVHHTARGIIVIGCDHLGTGAGSEPDRTAMSFERLAEANRTVVDEVLRRLRSGELAPGTGAIEPRAVIGAGQSYGGLLLIVQQARLRTFDAIAVLGFCATGVVMPVAHANVTTVTGGVRSGGSGHSEHPLGALAYPFFWEDVPPEIVEADLSGSFPVRADPAPPWASSRRARGTRDLSHCAAHRRPLGCRDRVSDLPRDGPARCRSRSPRGAGLVPIGSGHHPDRDPPDGPHAQLCRHSRPAVGTAGQLDREPTRLMLMERPPASPADGRLPDPH